MAMLVRGSGSEPPARPANEALFESNAMAMQAVLDGVGVAVAQLCYVSNALAAGRVVAPFPIIAHKHESWPIGDIAANRQKPRHASGALLPAGGPLFDQPSHN